MSKNQSKEAQGTLIELLDDLSSRQNGVPFEGYVRDDQNLPGNILVVSLLGSFYSFPKTAVISSKENNDGTQTVWVAKGTKAFHSTSFHVGEISEFEVGMEFLSPPAPVFDPDAPTIGESVELEAEVLQATLAGAMSAWSNRCAGGDSYQNNCAHYLSDAFIRAGFSELARNNSHINARCGSSAKRPIRARDMWSWFQSKARRTSRTVQRNTGNWAIFQLDERQYWGGHVVLLNSNTWKYYGTGWYGNWNQYLYQW